MSAAAAAKEDSECDCGAEQADNEKPEPQDPVQPQGLPVDRDFHPLKSTPRRLPEKSQAHSLGVFTLGMADKIATNIESDTSVAVGQDIKVMVFSVRLPGQNDDEFIAYQVAGETGQPRRIDPHYITNVRYQPAYGDRVLTLQISDPVNLHLKGETVYLLRGPATTEGESTED